MYCHCNLDVAGLADESFGESFLNRKKEAPELHTSFINSVFNPMAEHLCEGLEVLHIL